MGSCDAGECISSSKLPRQLEVAKCTRREIGPGSPVAITCERLHLRAPVDPLSLLLSHIESHHTKSCTSALPFISQPTPKIRQYFTPKPLRHLKPKDDETPHWSVRPNDAMQDVFATLPRAAT
jgi:hypothetical protein